MSVPGTYRHWRVVDNPEYEGKEPTPLTAACHDGSPFLTISCPKCGAPNHLHETLDAGLADDVIVAMRCAGCRRYTDMPLAFVRSAFAQLREMGWVA